MASRCRLFLVAVLTACGGEGPVGPFPPDPSPPPPPPQPIVGMVRVELAVMGLELDDSVSVLLNGEVSRWVRPGLPGRLPIPGWSLAVGQPVALALGDVAPNCMVEPAGPVPAISTAGEGTRVRFTLSCRPTGSLAGVTLAIRKGDSIAVIRDGVIRGTFRGFSAAWSHDGSRLAIAEDDAVAIRSMPGLGVTSRFPSTPGWPDDLAWSPVPGGRIAFFNCIPEDDWWWSGDCNHELWLAREENGEWTSTRISDGPLWTPAWAPDGSRLVAASYFTIEGFSPDGAPLGPLLQHPGIQLFGPAFTSDGASITYLHWESFGLGQRPRRFDLVGGTDTSIPAGWATSVWQFQVLPDARLLMAGQHRQPEPLAHRGRSIGPQKPEASEQFKVVHPRRDLPEAEDGWRDGPNISPG